MTEYEWWSVLGQWAGALVTSVAVIVALWTARLPYSKKLKVSYSTGITVGLGTEDIYCIVTATNVGQRDINIGMIGLLIENKQLFMPSTIGECQRIIKTAESVSHSMSYNDIKKAIVQGAFNKNSKFYAFAKDEEGKRYKISLKIKAKYFLKN